MKPTKHTTKSITPIQEGTKQAAIGVLTPVPIKLSGEQLKLSHTLHEWRGSIYTTYLLLRCCDNLNRGKSSFTTTYFEIGSIIGDYGVHESQPYFSVKLGIDGLEVVNGKL